MKRFLATILGLGLAGCEPTPSAMGECDCFPSQERRTLTFENFVAVIEPPKGDELIVAVQSDFAANVVWLPAMPAEHKKIKVLNLGPQGLNLFPVAGETINGASSVTLLPTKGIELQPFNPTIWHATD